MRKLAAAAALVCALLTVASAGAATRQGDHEGGKKKAHAAKTAHAKKAHAKKTGNKGIPASQRITRGGHAAAPPIHWGVADDFSKYADDGGSWFYQQLQGANLTQNRWTLAWNPSNPTAITELPFVKRAAPKAQAAGIAVMIVLYAGANGTSIPDAKNHDADAFCAWAGTVASTVAQWGIHDLVVWNEPNTAKYWSPQKDDAGNDVAAAPFEALMAKCYDSIHAADPNANVIGMGLSPRASQPKTSNAPLSFLRDVGAAYRASGRTTPIMDQLALHPYPVAVQTGSPDIGYTNTPDAFGPPDLDRVKQAVYDAFNGTGQPTTLNGLTFRIDEYGWQTITDGLSQYTGAENAHPPGLPNPIDEATQAQFLQLAASKYLACDPTVTDVELFLLVDEADRAGWQSGLMTAGGEGVSTAKQAYGALASTFAAGRSACTAGQITWSPSGGNSSAGGDTSNSGTTKASLAKKRAAAIKKCNARFKGKANAKKRAACVKAAKKKFSAKVKVKRRK